MGFACIMVSDGFPVCYPPGFWIKIFEKDTDKYIMVYQAEGCAGLTLLVG